MSNTAEKYKARELRKTGKSLTEISAYLNIPKSTVSVWCRDIALSAIQIDRLAAKQQSGSYKGRMKFLSKLRRERKEQVARLKKEALREIGKIRKRDLFISGVGMYWSEGTTFTGGNEVSFSNSNPRMLLFMLKWFRDICGVGDNRFTIQIRINQAHNSRIKKIERYWSRLLKIPLSQFTKTILIRTSVKKIYPNPENYFGTVRIRVRRGTAIRRKISGWIGGLAQIISRPA